MPSRLTERLAAATLIFAIPSSVQSQPCDDWTRGPASTFPGVFGSPDSGAPYVSALTTWRPDNNTTGAKYVVLGGKFLNVAGDTPANHIVTWDGRFWQTMAGGMNGEVSALTTWDPDGPGGNPPLLIAGGRFTTAGGVAANRIAAWNGTAWAALGPGFDGPVASLIVWDPDGTGAQPPELVAAGSFYHAGTTETRAIARWDGSQWRPMGTWFNYGIDGMTLWDPDGPGPLGSRLVVVGAFSILGDGDDINCDHVAWWDGSHWRALGIGVGSYPSVVKSWDPDGAAGPQNPLLIVAGSFGSAGGHPAVNIAAWNGSDWFALHEGLTGGWDNARCNSVAVWDPDGDGPLGEQLIALGKFETAGSTPAQYAARWDGLTWHALMPPGQVIENWPFESLVWDRDGTSGPLPPDLVMGGFLTAAGGRQLNGVGRWDRTQWSAFAPAPVGYAGALLGSRIVIGGDFKMDTPFGNARNLATWDGVDIKPLGTGFVGGFAGPDAPIRALETYTSGSGPTLRYNMVAGGEFASVGGIAAGRIALWSESPFAAIAEWNPMGPGFNGTVLAIERFNGRTYAGGQFTASGATALNRIASFNGTAWEAVGPGPTTGVNGNVRALKAYNGSMATGAIHLVVGGEFISAGGVAANRIAQYNASTQTAITSWTAMGQGFNNTVRAIERHSGSTYAAGSFTASGDGAQTFNHIARWDTSLNPDAWVPVGAGLNGAVYSLLSYNGFLYAGGFFSVAGAVPADCLARWDGSNWTEVRGGADFTITSLTGYNNEVHALGGFDNVRAGALYSPGWARFLTTGIPWIARQPSSIFNASRREDVAFQIAAADGYANLSYQWRRNGNPVSPGPTGTGSSVLLFDGGAYLALNDVSDADEREYDCIVSNPCGSATSVIATLAVCMSDVDGNHQVDPADVSFFVSAWFTSVNQGTLAGDVDANGAVEPADVSMFVSTWFREVTNGC